MRTRDSYGRYGASPYGAGRRGHRFLLPVLLVLFALASITAAVLIPALREQQATPKVLAPAPSSPAAMPSPNAEVAPAVEVSGLGWEDFGGIQLPSSDIDGPARREEALAAGFTRTPRGALLAAVNIAVRTAPTWGPDVFEPTITTQVMGPDAETLLARTRDAYDTQRKSQTLGRAVAVQEGWRWQVYTPDVAVVDLVSAAPGRGGTTVRAATRVQLVWQDQDWHLVAPPGGDWRFAATPLAAMDGFNRFGGQG